MRLGLLHALIVALALAPTAQAQVTVEAAGQYPATLDLAALQSNWDVRERPYTVGGAPAVVSGLSIDRLLGAADVDPFNFTGATVEAGGSTLSLSRDQLIDPEAFTEGRPVFYPDGQGAAFLLPARGGQRVSGADVTVRLTAASDLRVSATASRTQADAGQRVAFAATVEGAGPDEDVRISWNLDGAGSATGAEASHRFRRPGTYKVVVGATSDANPTGASDIVTVRVGEAPDEPPDREGGGTNESVDAPDSGAASGPAEGAAKEHSADEAQSSAGAAAAERRRDRRSTERRRARETEARRRSAHRAKPDQPEREPVEGTQIGAPLEPPPEQGDRAAARTGAPQAPAPELPPEAVFGLIAAALVVAGAWWERRSRRSGTVGPSSAPAPPI